MSAKSRIGRDPRWPTTTKRRIAADELTHSAGSFVARGAEQRAGLRGHQPGQSHRGTPHYCLALGEDGSETHRGTWHDCPGEAYQHPYAAPQLRPASSDERHPPSITYRAGWGTRQYRRRSSIWSLCRTRRGVWRWCREETEISAIILSLSLCRAPPVPA